MAIGRHSAKEAQMNRPSNKNSNEVSQVLAQGARADLINYAIMVQEPFVLNWHHELIADRLMQIYDKVGRKGGLKNLMIEAPPQITNKSTMINLFIAFMMGNKPQINVLLGSYRKEQADMQSSKIMGYISSPAHHDVFGQKIHPRKRAVGSWCTTGNKDGLCTTFSMKSLGSGKSSSINVIDDALQGTADANSKKVRDAAYRIFKVDLKQRVLPSIGATVYISTRWHYDDIHGRLEQEYKEMGKDISEDWEIITLPAIADKDYEWTLSDGRKVGYKKGESLVADRFSVDELEKRKRDMGSMAWQAQYLQNPIANETQLFKKELWKVITQDELKLTRSKRFLMLDSSTGTGQDYTGFADVRVDTTTGYWYVEAWHEKLKSNDLMKRMFELQKVNNYVAVGIEDGLQAKTLLPFVERRMEDEMCYFPLILVSTGNKDKESRITNTLQHKYENSEIFHIEGKCDELEVELEQFPAGRNEDISDALAHMQTLLTKVSIHNNEDMNYEAAIVPDYS